MRRIEFIPASLGSRPTSFRGPKIRARQPKIHQPTAEISPEVFVRSGFFARVLYVGDSRRHDEPLQAKEAPGVHAARPRPYFTAASICCANASPSPSSA